MNFWHGRDVLYNDVLFFTLALKTKALCKLLFVINLSVSAVEKQTKVSMEPAVSECIAKIYCAK